MSTTANDRSPERHTYQETVLDPVERLIHGGMQCAVCGTARKQPWHWNPPSEGSTNTPGRAVKRAPKSVVLSRAEATTAWMALDSYLMSDNDAYSMFLFAPTVAAAKRAAAKLRAFLDKGGR